MNKKGFATVRRMGLALPNVEEGTTHGSPCLKVRGKMFTCIAINKSAEPGTLAVRLPFEQRDELMAAEPETYYITDHYINYPCVLVRMARIHPDALRDLLAAGHRFMSTSGGVKRRVKRRVRH